MRRFLPAGSSLKELLVNPFDPMSSKLEILKTVALTSAGSRLGFNLTGGTKLMFAGAIAACRKIGGVPFYFETRDHSLIFLHDFSTMPMRGIHDVEQFFALKGFQISRPGKWEENLSRQQRIQLTRRLWIERAAVATLYKQLSNCIPQDGMPFPAFSLSTRHARARLEESGRAIFSVGDAEFKLQSCPDFARYLCGGWLEEYVYLLLEPQLKTGVIKDLRIGLEVAWAPQDLGSAQTLAQEFDVCFTDGNRLTILECKAGGVIVNDVYKLGNNVANYGGIDAKGVLVTAFMPSESIRKRIDASANLQWLAGAAVAEDLPHSI